MCLDQKTKAMLKRAEQESKYFNTVYDDLVDKYINKDLYPGFGDVKPKFKMQNAPDDETQHLLTPQR